jgi:enamine deaminase RidA (YjgF/YER057c/UK114 family)
MASKTGEENRIIAFPMSSKDSKNMKTAELETINEVGSLLRDQRRSVNVVLNCTEAGEGQVFLVASVSGEEDASRTAREIYSRIAEALSDRRMTIVHERIFGSLTTKAVVLRERKDALCIQQVPLGGPITYIAADPPWGEGLSGIIIHAVSLDNVDDVWTIMDGERPCGRGWRRNGTTYLQLQNIHEHTGSRPDQVRGILERAEGILTRNGASYKDVARTWFYLSDILDWYADFNKARSEKYGEFGIMPGPGDSRLLLPASTGIGADAPSGAAASMNLLAVVRRDDTTLPVRKLTNRGQLDAFRYGAAFSRGAVIEENDVKVIEVSGTAAIDEHGTSLYPGDIRSQVICTLDKIETLLGQEGAGLADICTATVFVKRPEYAEVFRQVAVDQGLADFPAVCVVAAVCREELLFEIDAEAAVRRRPDEIRRSDN